MKIIVGLGNPGEKYTKNRHNVGFMVVDQLTSLMGEGKWEASIKFKGEIWQTREVILLKPTTFMNESGLAVGAICNFYKVEFKDLYIVHDDLDISLGNYKIQHGKGPQVHNGLRSIEEKLGTDQFWNVRVGVENREVRGNRGIPGVVYSLQDFQGDEVKIIASVIGKIVSELKEVVI